MMSKFQDVIDGLVRLIESGYTIRTGKLAGRSSPATGAIEEISLSASLTLVGGVLDISPAVGTGTVTSVAQTVPAEFSVAGSPITTSGTLAISKATQTANKVWASATSGGAAQPAFRALVTADMPAGTGTVTSVALSLPNNDTLTISGSPVTTSGTLTATPVDPNADRIPFWDDSAGKIVYLSVAGNIAIVGTVLQHSECWCIECGDETTAITTGTAKRTFRMPYAGTLTGVRASLTAASSSGIPTFDINESGTTVLSTKLTIDASETTSTTAATAAVISDSALADDAEITIDFDVAGTGAKGPKIYMYIQKT